MASSFFSKFSVFLWYSSFLISCIDFSVSLASLFPKSSVHLSPRFFLTNQSYLVRVPLNSFAKFLSFVIFQFHEESVCLSIDHRSPSWRIFRRTTHASIVSVHHGLTTRTRIGVVQRLRDTSITFHTVMRILIRHNYRDEVILVWLTLVWDFAPVSCKQIQSDKWEPGWTHTGMKVVPISREHPLSEREEDAFFLSTEPNYKITWKHRKVQKRACPVIIFPLRFATA